jgi:membrane associated rhomboid family serine protease
MFPIRDNIPAQRFPAVTIWLIVVNALCFAYELQLGPGAGHFLIAHGFIPARFLELQSHNFLDLGRFGPLFSSMFLHGGWLHLLSNMWMLWIFGDNVEDSMGHGRYLIFYLLCGVVSVLAQTWSAPHAEVPLIGASGAISGVLGAYIVTYPRARILTLIPLFIIFYMMEIPAYFFLGFWFLLQFLQGYAQLASVGLEGQGGVAFWAHVGGFTSGVLLVFLFRQKNGKPARVMLPRPWGWK